MLAAVVLATSHTTAQDQPQVRALPKPPEAVTADGAIPQPSTTQAKPTEITLQRIMADQRWVARSPRGGHWSLDGSHVLFQRDRAEGPLRDVWRIDIDPLTAQPIADPAMVDDVELHRQDPALTGQRRAWNADRSRAVFDRNGDVFVRSIADGSTLQLTRTSTVESGAMFLLDGRVAFRRDGQWLARDLDAGTEQQLGDVRPGERPENATGDRPSDPYVDRSQERLFDVLRERASDEDARRARERRLRELDASAPPQPAHVGKGKTIASSALSPSGQWVAVTTAGESRPAKPDAMPVWVTEDGYVEQRSVRSLVGTGASAEQGLLLVHSTTGAVVPVDLELLTGRRDDPLEAVREENKKHAQQRSEKDAKQASAAKRDGAEVANPADKPKEAPKPRPVFVRGVRFNDDGTWLAAMVGTSDNKDRWLIAIPINDIEAARAKAERSHAESDKERKASSEAGSTSAPAPVVASAVAPLEVDRLHDPAWIGWDMADFGFVPGSARLWFISERTGFGHLYLADPARTARDRQISMGVRQLTAGRFVVGDVQLTSDGRWAYVRTNRLHPGRYEIERIELSTGAFEQVTRLGGTNEAWLSHDGSKLLIEHSSALGPPELWAQPAEPGAQAHRLTRTVEDSWASLAWVHPQFVAIPGRVPQPIHARLYLPPENARERSATDKGRPAVLFVHGAGYLQNAHQGWSSYQREMMFHTLLAQRGCVVLDMDFRASAGYGRDWRTAVYRNMGEPEIDDLAAGIDWLVEQHGVDRARVGVYGGSYGGFVTLMAMFKRPGMFAAGAALRPVTDWAHYNHGYTSNILNAPDVDPLAYERSSPIEHAAGLDGALLIAHGMIDDNVFYKDSVRLAQRLIELGKDRWELAGYPVEPHAYVEPSSWLDQYRRILLLFERELGLAPPADAAAAGR